MNEIILIKSRFNEIIHPLMFKVFLYKRRVILIQHQSYSSLLFYTPLAAEVLDIWAFLTSFTR